jgi:hypothetical protein
MACSGSGRASPPDQAGSIRHNVRMAKTEPQVESIRRRMRTRAEALTARGQAGLARLDGQRPRHVSIEIAFRWMLRDRRIAGGVLGGGLAYRLFFWMLAVVLLVSGGLGFAADSRSHLRAGVTDSGLSKAFADSVVTAARESQSGRWWLLALGAFFTLWFSWGLLRALRLVHAAAWQIPVPPLRNAPRSVASVMIAPVVILALGGASGWIRAHTSIVPGVGVVVLVGAAYAGLGVLVSMHLPARDVPWTAFLPGAIGLGIGVDLLNAFAVYFLADRLASQSALYGTLGLASTALFYLFLIGRGVVWAAELNAVTWEVRHPQADASTGPGPEPTLPRM